MIIKSVMETFLFRLIYRRKRHNITVDNHRKRADGEKKSITKSVKMFDLPVAYMLQ